MWCPKAKRRRINSSESGISDGGDNDNVGGGDEPATVMRVGSRKSKLALIQSKFVIEEAKKFYSTEDFQYELIERSTTGDHILDQPLAQIGSKSLFTKELEEGLLDGTIDFVVHSLKDLPTTLPPNLCIAAILEREDPNDALVLKNSINLENPFQLIDLPAEGEQRQEWLKSNNLTDKIVIGTSSLRRIAQLRRFNPNVQAIDIRGNITTRLNKLDNQEGPYSALILACAGLTRAEHGDRISFVLKDNWWHAVGQGALAVECREDDASTIRFLSPLIHCKTTYEVVAERVFMAKLEGGCSVPLGVRCTWDPPDIVNEDFGDDKRTSIKLTIHGSVFSIDGTKSILSSEEGNLLESTDFNGVIEETKHFTGICLPPANAPCYSAVKRNFINSAKIGLRLADKFKSLGAIELLEEIRKSKDKVSV